MKSGAASFGRLLWKEWRETLKILIIGGLVALFVRAGSSIQLARSSGNTGEIERIQARGELVVSLNKGYPPFAMVEGERVIGLDADLARLLADYLGVDLRFIWPETYDQQIPRLLAGDSDIIMAAMTRTVKRGLRVSFTAPYFKVSQAALVHRKRLPAGADSYFDLLDIDGLRLGVKAGTTHEEFARELFAQDAIRREGHPVQMPAQGHAPERPQPTGQLPEEQGITKKKHGHKGNKKSGHTKRYLQ